MKIQQLLQVRTRLGVARLGVLVLALALAAAACGGSSGGGPAAPGPNGVNIVDYAFNPTTLTVPVGTTVTWTNTASRTHTVTLDDGSFDQQVLAGANLTHAFATAGTFTYHCSIHTQMTGTVVVTP